MKSIYIVMSQTGTILSKAIKGVTGAEYNHVSISFRKDLEPMYSFGRKYENIPWKGTLVEEHIYSGTFKKFSETTCRVIEIPVDDAIYNAAKEFVEYMISRQKEDGFEYKYNILGLIYALFGKKRLSNTHYYCSEFVREVLFVAGLDCSDISYCVPKPVDFNELLKKIEGAKVIYEGLLSEYPYQFIPKKSEELCETTYNIRRRILSKVFAFRK